MKETLLALSIPLMITPEPSATLESNKIRIERENKQVVYNWGLGANPLPTPQIVQKALSENSSEKFYGSPAGIPKLAKLIAKRDSIGDFGRS